MVAVVSEVRSMVLSALSLIDSIGRSVVGGSLESTVALFRCATPVPAAFSPATRLRIRWPWSSGLRGYWLSLSVASALSGSEERRVGDGGGPRGSGGQSTLGAGPQEPSWVVRLLPVSAAACPS